MLDMVAKGRLVYGTRQWLAKITDSNVRDIRRRVANGESGTDIARELGIAQSQVSRIARGLAWKRVV
jgi:hypothetical protein